MMTDCRHYDAEIVDADLKVNGEGHVLALCMECESYVEIRFDIRDEMAWVVVEDA